MEISLSQNGIHVSQVEIQLPKNPTVTSRRQQQLARRPDKQSKIFDFPIANMDRFLGTWRLERSEMFDEYLTARGVPWLIRKMMQASWITKVFERIDDNTYSLTNKSPMSTLAWKFQFGQTFEGKGFDGKMHKITFDLKGDQLFETHVRVEDAQRSDHAETYRYERQDDYIVLNLQHEQIHAKRFFKKQPDATS